MRLEQLQYLTELTKIHLIIIAAEWSFISHSSVSGAIKKLKELNIILFVRISSGVFFPHYTTKKAIDRCDLLLR